MNSGHYKDYDFEPAVDSAAVNEPRARRSGLKNILSCFVGGTVGGIVACLTVQALLSGKTTTASCSNDANHVQLHARGEPWVGSTQVVSYPPATPTNYYPSLFPTDVGYLGTIETGAEPGLIETAPSQPLQTGAAALVAPAYDTLPESWSNKPTFNIFRNWGDSTPWYSVPLGAFGIYEGSAPPAGCNVEALYLLIRHGSRYPGAGGGTSALAANLGKTASEWTATGSLAFLNDWTYKLGAEILTTFGRQQEFDLGVSMRLKYGFLLDNFTAEDRVPVFRTTSEDRMVATAANFGLGFFGWPTDGQYEQIIMIQETGFNNTLHPSSTCANSGNSSRSNGNATVGDEWQGIYLADAQKRLQADLVGFNLTTSDVFYMQELCAYETVSIGYSAFCDLFTEEEWEGYDYASDLSLWYQNAFGSPMSRTLGLGYVQELVSRLTQTPITVYNSSTNSTWDSNPITWPLGNSIYVDASHGNVLSAIITALNLTSLAAAGPLPGNYIPEYRTFRTNQLFPFGSNIQFQQLSCPTTYGSDDGKYMRIVINDGAVPLTGVGECPESTSGLCPLSTFIAGQQVTAETVDWNWGCNGNWTLPPGYVTTDGSYPPPPAAM